MSRGKIISLLFFLIIAYNGFPQSAISKRYDFAYNNLQFNNPQQAVVVVDSIISLHQNEVPIWKLLSLKAKLFLKLRNVNAAIETALRSDSFYNQTFHTPYPSAQSVLGIAYKDLGNLKKAHEHFALVIDNTTDPVTKIINLFNLSSVALTVGDTTNAIRYFQENFNFIIEPPVSYAKAYCMRAYADIQFVMNNDEVALYWYKNSYKAFNEINSLENAGFACANIARVFTKNKAYDSSLFWMKKALLFQEKNNGCLGLADAMLCYANYYLTIGNNEQALVWFKKALPQTLQANVEDFLEENYKGLSLAYERVGDLENSFLYLKKYDAIVDSVAKRKWFNSLTDVHYNYEISQREKKINRLQNLLAQNIIIVIIISIAVSAITVFILLKKSKNKSKNISVKAEQIIETSIQETNLLTNKNNNLIESFSKEKEKIWLHLIDILEKDEVFCNPDISLLELAHKLNTNRTTLSEIINKKSSHNFTSFINEYRIKKACFLLGDENSNYLSVEGIALKSGFRSRSTFYTAFNNVMGISPNIYRKNHQ